MNFASKYVNLGYDSEEDGEELSDSEIQGGFDSLNFDVMDSDSEGDDDINEEKQQQPLQPPPARPGSFSSSSSFSAGRPVSVRGEQMLASRSKRQISRSILSSSPSVSGVRYKQRVNTNVVSLNLGTLAGKADQLQTGDPVFCSAPGCGCVFSAISKLRYSKKGVDDMQGGKDEDANEREGGERIWDCEFCGKANVVDLEDEEIPTGISQDYLIETAPQNAAGQQVAHDERLIIFCIDTSSSMASGAALPGSLKLKGDGRFTSYTQNGWRPGTTWVTSLQAVQAAVDQQLENFAKTCPNYRVALIEFNSDLTIYGDGSTFEKKVSGQDLYDAKKLQEAGKEYTVTKPISDSHERLSECLYKLRHGGRTALGPALVAAVSMASAKRGSKVVLCTDGYASKGLGALTMVPEAEVSGNKKWYGTIGDEAVRNGVTVDIVSIASGSCDIETIGGVCDQTNGRVDKIKIAEITTNFSGILENPIVATNVNAKMFVHRGLRLRSDAEEVADMSIMSASPRPTVDKVDSSSSSPTDSNKNQNGKRKRGSLAAEPNSEDKKEGAPEQKKKKVRERRLIVDRIARDVGNATSDTEAFFEFSVRKSGRKLWQHLKGLPFQVQIEYTRLDGTRCMRVMTQLKETTLSKSVAEDHADVSVLAALGSKKSASLAQMGDYESSRRVNYGHAVFMDRVSNTGVKQEIVNRFARNVSSWDRSVSNELSVERYESPHTPTTPVAVRSHQRSRRRNDELSNNMYLMKSMSSGSYSSGGSRTPSASFSAPLRHHYGSAPSAPAQFGSSMSNPVNRRGVIRKRIRPDLSKITPPFSNPNVSRSQGRFGSGARSGTSTVSPDLSKIAPPGGPPPQLGGSARAPIDLSQDSPPPGSPMASKVQAGAKRARYVFKGTIDKVVNKRQKQAPQSMKKEEADKSDAASAKKEDSGANQNSLSSVTVSAVGMYQG